MLKVARIRHLTDNGAAQGELVEILGFTHHDKKTFAVVAYLNPAYVSQWGGDIEEIELQNLTSEV